MNIKGQFNNERGFGVEIEILRPTNVSKEDICDELDIVDIECHEEGYNHDTRPHWKLTSDGSVKANPSWDASDAYNGFMGSNEVVSPILYGEDGFNQLKTVLDTLNGLGCKINYTCGIHVHHDVTDKMLEGKKPSEKFLSNLVKFIAKYEHLIYKLVSPSRLDNRDYSTPVRVEYLDCNSNNRNVTDWKVKDMIKNIKKDCKRKDDRYGSEIHADYVVSPTHSQKNRECGLNFRNVWKRGSVEFRYHNGSTNFEKIRSWVVFTQAIINAVEEAKSVQISYVPNNVDGLFYLKKAIGFIGDTNRDDVTEKATQYISKRFKQLSERETDYSRHYNYEFVKDGIKQGVIYRGLGGY